MMSSALIRDVAIAGATASAATVAMAVSARRLDELGYPIAATNTMIGTMGTGLALAVIGKIARSMNGPAWLGAMFPLGLGAAGGALLGTALGLSRTTT